MSFAHKNITGSPFGTLPRVVVMIPAVGYKSHFLCECIFLTRSKIRIFILSVASCHIVELLLNFSTST
jgi:hypothetical protein